MRWPGPWQALGKWRAVSCRTLMIYNNSFLFTLASRTTHKDVSATLALSWAGISAKWEFISLCLFLVIYSYTSSKSSKLHFGKMVSMPERKCWWRKLLISAGNGSTIEFLVIQLVWVWNSEKWLFASVVCQLMYNHLFRNQFACLTWK